MFTSKQNKDRIERTFDIYVNAAPNDRTQRPQRDAVANTWLAAAVVGEAVTLTARDTRILGQGQELMGCCGSSSCSSHGRKVC